MATSGSFNKVPQAIQAIHNGTVVAVRRASQQVADTYAQTAAIDTGYLRLSAYTSFSDASTYNQAVGRAKGRANREPLPEVERPGDDLTGIVAVAAQYALPVETGTSRMAAQPALTPAAETMRGQLRGIIAEEINKAIKAALGG